MRSIRTYLLSRLLGGTACVLAFAGVLVFLALTRSLEAQFDRNLADRVEAFGSILFQSVEGVEFEFSDELMPEYEPGERPAYFQLHFAGGTLLEASNSLGRDRLEAPGPFSFEPSFWTAELPDGREGRFVAQWVEVHHVYPEEGPGRPEAAILEVVIARGREALIAAERLLLVQCALGALLLMGTIATLTWFAVGRGLEPAQRLAQAVDGLQPDALPEGLAVGPLPKELAPIANKTEALMTRVSGALERERRTTADIAHELRTPISEILTASEVALRNGGDPSGTRVVLGNVRDVAWRMGRSLSTVLKLARLEMGSERFESSGVDLGSLVREVVRSLGAVARERRLVVENAVPAGAIVEGDPDVLRIVVSNLLSNALYYSPEGATVGCRLLHGEGWSLVVENQATDLNPEDLEALTQPFWRKDGARTDRHRSGLGLALSCALAERAQLRLSFELVKDRFRARLQG